MEVQGRLAIVTGSGRGIGRSVALGLAGLGCNIVVNYSEDETAALATVAEIETLGTRALAVQGDVSRDADCRRIVGEAQAHFGRVDVLINNAATTVFVTHQELDALTDEMWDRVFAVNVRGAFNMARAASPLLRASGRGAIVNVSSVASLSGGGSSIPYAASKAALNSLTISLARVLAPEVRVNGVAPGFVDTRWVADGYGDRVDAMRKAVRLQTPMRDVGRPEHIAQAVTSLLTGMDWVTGQTIVIDGGHHIRT